MDVSEARKAFEEELKIQTGKQPSILTERLIDLIVAVERSKINGK